VHESWAQEAYRRLAETGHRSGGARQEVIESLARHGGCTTAQELLHRLRTDDRRVATATVYRALATLRELRLLRAFDHGEGVLRYELEEPIGGRHHHFVCDECGASEPFDDDRIANAIISVAADHHYDLAAHDVVLFGRCRACAQPGG
jgi:Fur family ferric uptake transcriptional regulator